MGGKFNTRDEQSYEVLDKNSVLLLNGGRLNDQQAAFQNYNAQLLYKKTFPKPVKIGSRAVAWRKNEVDRWIFSRKPTKGEGE